LLDVNNKFLLKYDHCIQFIYYLCLFNVFIFCLKFLKSQIFAVLSIEPVPIKFSSILLKSKHNIYSKCAYTFYKDFYFCLKSKIKIFLLSPTHPKIF